MTLNRNAVAAASVLALALLTPGTSRASIPVLEVTNGGLDWPAYQVFVAMQNPDGSYYWQDEQDPPTRSFLIDDVATSTDFLLTGGTGTATIYLPVTITELRSESDYYGPTGALISNQGHGNASLAVGGDVFNLYGTQTRATPISLLFTYVVPYNQTFEMGLGVDLTVTTNPADNDVALCGSPGPSNMTCSLESTMSLTTSLDAPYYEIPYGSRLSETDQPRQDQYATVMVPEPSDCALMLGGLGVLGLMGRRRQGARRRNV